MCMVTREYATQSHPHTHLALHVDTTGRALLVPVLVQPAPEASFRWSARSRVSLQTHVECLVVWPTMASKTAGFADNRLSPSTQDSPGTLFLSKAGTASAILHEHCAQVRERALRRKTGTTLSLRQYTQRAFRDWERGKPPGKKDLPHPLPGGWDGLGNRRRGLGHGR